MWPPAFDWGAFAGDEKRGRRRDIELLRVVALVDGDADAAAGVNVQERLADGHFHKSLHVRQSKRLLVELHNHFVAQTVAEILEFFARYIADERAKRIIEADDVAFDALFRGDGDFWIQLNKLGDFRADEIVVPSGGEMCGHGREDVAAVKRGRNRRLNHPVGIGDFARGIQAVAVQHRRDEPVVGKNEVLALLGLHDDGFARSADSGIHDHKKHRTGRVIRRDTLKKTRALLDRKRRHLMRDVHNPRLGRNAEYHGFADGHRIVGRAEVGHEDNRLMRGGLPGIRRLPAPRRHHRSGNQAQCESTNRKTHDRSAQTEEFMRASVCRVEEIRQDKLQNGRAPRGASLPKCLLRCEDGYGSARRTRRGPKAMSLPGRSRRMGIRRRTRASHGTRAGPCELSAGAMRRFCMSACMR